MEDVTYGYGFTLEDASPKVLELIKEFPEDYSDYKEWLKEYDAEEDNDSAMEWIDEGDGGLTGYLCRKIYKVDGINLVFDPCYDDIIFPENLPWLYEEKERNLSKQDVNKIFRKWLGKILDNPDEIDIDERSIGGY